MTIKKGDFVEVEYTGRLSTGEVFDTTDEKIAREHHLFQEGAEYKPVIICVGEGHILKSIDEFLVGKDVGAFKLELSAEKAFGKKDPRLLRMIPVSKFKAQDIKPVPGLRLNIDGAIGIVRSVTGGRTVVDFNHPLAGRDVVYDFKVNKIVTDKKAQLEALLKSLLGVSADVKIEGGNAELKLPVALPDKLVEELKKKVKELVMVDLRVSVKPAGEKKEGGSV